MLPLVWAVTLAASQPRLAVLDVKAHVGVSPDLAAALTDAITVEVRRRNPKVQVLGASDIRAMLDVVRRRMQSNCAATAACLAEIGGALGANSIVSSSLSKFGGTYLLAVQLVDVRGARVVREASARIKGQDEEMLDAVGRTLAELFPEVAAPRPPPPIAAAPPPAALPEPAVSPAAAEVAQPASASHSTWPRWAFLGGAAVSAAFAVVGAVEVGNYLGEDSAVKSGQLPAGLTFQKYQGDRSSADAWGSAALALGAVAIGCVAGAVLTW